MNHPPRNKQGRPCEPSLWANEPIDDALPLPYLCGGITLQKIQKICRVDIRTQTFHNI
jgi:hypothetical protein